jgi:hypothetical protein
LFYDTEGLATPSLNHALVLDVKFPAGLATDAELCALYRTLFRCLLPGRIHRNATNEATVTPGITSTVGRYQSLEGIQTNINAAMGKPGIGWT